MIPILYKEDEKDFTTLGIGPLGDAIKCIVTEELNGAYELEMTYPVNGIHYSDLVEDRLIYAKPFEGGSKQIFKIYQIDKPLNGEVVVRAEHIHYLLNKMVVAPFEATTCAEAIGKLEGYIIDECPFTFTTDKTTETETQFKMIVPLECGKVLGGTEGSILDVFGSGDYEFDNFHVILHKDRGVDNGITVRYGKNMTELNSSVDTTNVYTGVIPYYRDSEDMVTYAGDGPTAVWSDHKDDYAYPMAKVLDVSSWFDAEREAWEQEQSESETPSEEEYKPTAEEITKKATEFLVKNEGWSKTNNIKVSFVNLWQTDEYADVAVLERARMCDRVTVVYKKLGVSVTKKVIKTEYNVLLERYESLELGTPEATLAKEVASTSTELKKAVVETKGWMDKAIDHATKLICGGLGGYVVINRNAAGHPNEILIMDTPSKATAVNVWRFNLNGLGHSHNGYNGPFDDIALTADGKINATMITTGELDANIIKAGVITDKEGKFSLNMETGALTMKDGLFMGTISVGADGSDRRTVINGDNTVISGEEFNSSTQKWEVKNQIDPISGREDRILIDSPVGMEIRMPRMYVSPVSNPGTDDPFYEATTVYENSQNKAAKSLSFVVGIEKDMAPHHTEEHAFMYTYDEEGQAGYPCNGTVYCTLPVFLKKTTTTFKVVNGILTSKTQDVPDVF